MGYYLQYDGVDDRVSISKSISFSDVTFKWVGVFDSLAVDNGLFQWYPQAASSPATETNFLVWYDAPNGVQAAIRQGQTAENVVTPGLAGLTSGTRYRIEVRVRNAVSLDVSVYDDEAGTLIGSQSEVLTASYDSLTSLYIGDGQLARPLKGALYRFEVAGNAAFTESFYDPSASNGTGSVLPDTTSSNNGTLLDFPTDDTQWVFYSSTNLTVTPADLPLAPGGTISGTYADYATIPTTLTVSDGTNTITIASPTITDNGDGTGSFSGTMPALPTTGTANLVLFGNVTVELA